MADYLFAAGCIFLALWTAFRNYDGRLGLAWILVGLANAYAAGYWLYRIIEGTSS